MTGHVIEGTNYSDGDEVQHESTLCCPESCEVPQGFQLVQVVPPGTAFSTPCPNDCGLAVRVVVGGDRS